MPVVALFLSYFNAGTTFLKEFGFFSIRLTRYVYTAVTYYLQFLYFIYQAIRWFLTQFYNAAKAAYDFFGIVQLGFSDGVKDTCQCSIDLLDRVRAQIPITNRIERVLSSLVTFVFWAAKHALKFTEITLLGFRFYLILAFIWILYKFIGEPLLYAGANPQMFFNNANVAWIGSLSASNIGIVFVNSVIFIFNVTQNLIYVVLGGIFKAITLVLGANENYNPENGVPRELEAFVPTRPDLASHAVAHRQLLSLSPPETMNEVTTYSNPVFETPDLSIPEKVVISIQTPIIFGLSVVFEYLLFWLEIAVKIWFPILGLIVSVVTDVGSLACCFAGIEAFGYCLIDYILKIFTVFIKLLKLPGTESIVRDILESNPVKSVPNAPCSCGKRLPQVAACRQATYTCQLSGSADRIKYISYKVTYPNSNPNDAKQTIWRTGEDRSVVCREFIEQQSRVRSGRGLEEIAPDCKTQCYKGISDSWQFKVCGFEKRYIGACDRTVPANKRQSHLNAYLKMPFVKAEERQQILSSEHAAKVVIIPEPIPDVLHIKLDRVMIMEFIKELEAEKIPYFDCIVEENMHEFSDFILRAVCLGMKFLYTRPWTDNLKILQGIQLNSPHIRSLIESQQEGKTWKQSIAAMHAVHIVWYNETFNEPSLLVKHGQLIHDLSSNISLQITQTRRLLEDGRLEIREENPTRRNLRTIHQDVGVFSASSPQCEYLCPDGINCLPAGQLANCRLPSGNWTTGILIRQTFHSFTVFFTSFDFQQTVNQILNCWYGYIRNPTIDPTTFQATLDILINGNTKDYVYCFPLLSHVPYLPLVSWSLAKYVEGQCGSTMLTQASTNEAFQTCSCPDYIASGAFDYVTAWTPFSFRFVSIRLYNAWREILFVLTRSSIFGFVWNIFYGFFVWLTPSQTSLLNFLNPGYETTGYWCFVLYIGYLLWFMIFIVLPFYGIMFIYWAWLMVIKNDIVQFLMSYALEVTSYINLVNHLRYKKDEEEVIKPRRRSLKKQRIRMAAQKGTP